MKKIIMLMVPVILLIACGLGLMAYIDSDNKGNMTEIAADALTDVAVAAADWSKDKRHYSVEVSHRLMAKANSPRPAQVSLLTVLEVVSAAKKTELCRRLPRVRDAISILLSGKFTPNAGDQDGALLTGYGEALKARLNSMLTTVQIVELKISRAPLSGYGAIGC